MTRVVVCDEQSILTVDSATIRAFVVDPLRLGNWSALEFMGCVREDLLSVGDVFHARLYARGPADKALRSEFVEWLLGSRYRCPISLGRVASDREIAVRVHSVLEGVGAYARVQFVHRADIPRWATSLYRLVVQRRLWRALKPLAHRFAL